MTRTPSQAGPRLCFWAAVGLLCLALPQAATASPLKRSFASGTLHHLNVDVQHADVELQGWDKTTVNVVAEDDRLHIEFKDGVLVIDDHKLKRRLSGKLLLQVPSKMAATLTTLSGDLLVQDMHSRVAIKSVSGEVQVHRLKGVLIVATVSGDMRIVDLTGRAELNSVSGEMDIRHATADLFEAQTVSGDIEFNRAIIGNVELNSQSGEIAFQGALPDDGGLKATSFSGDVMLHFSKDFAFELSAKSRSGDVHVDYPVTTLVRSSNKVTGSVGEGGPFVRVSTFSGEISISSR